ncbi:type II toxin-antitoxin system RelE/ParE family toxin [Chloroflexi bacterium TSY]|nr:type II toxin-antitoxin system RelE/ParE family toxin [Chloroflexi bacterium TSY]
MKKYRLDIGLVKRQIDRLPGHMKSRVKKETAQLAQQPRPAHAKELRLLPNTYRIRLDNHRIVYRIDDEIVLIIVLKVGRKRGPDFYQDIGSVSQSV